MKQLSTNGTFFKEKQLLFKETLEKKNFLLANQLIEKNT